ncbi:MAG: hypothetical protein C0397_03300 [Odoribacter sp.]|nr:hypothetical protein [Odoribacter sp.]
MLASPKPPPKRGLKEPALVYFLFVYCFLIASHGIYLQNFQSQTEAVYKVIDPVILNLFQDPNALYFRPRNKFGVTKFTSILTFETASWGWGF